MTGCERLLFDRHVINLQTGDILTIDSSISVVHEIIVSVLAGTLDVWMGRAAQMDATPTWRYPANWPPQITPVTHHDQFAITVKANGRPCHATVIFKGTAR